MATMAEEAIAGGYSYLRGHKVVWLRNKWVYADNLSDIPGNGGEDRTCKRCGATQGAVVGPDPCIGRLENVTNACCGHGESLGAYVMFENGTFLKHESAIEYFKRVKK